MIEYLLLLLAWPLGRLLAKWTVDEKKIYSKKVYFPLLIPLLGILAIVSFLFDRTAALTLAFIFITVFSWDRQT